MNIHYAGILTYLRARLSELSEKQKSQQRLRTATYLQQDAPISSSTTSKSLLNATATAKAAIITENFDNNDNDNNKSQAQQLTQQERVLLESENKTLLNELMGMETELEKVERSLLHISELQGQLEMYVSSQAENVDRLYKESEETTDKVLRGNFILHRLSQKGMAYRNYMIFFFLVMSFVLLFLHWYD